MNDEQLNHELRGWIDAITNIPASRMMDLGILLNEETAFIPQPTFGGTKRRIL